MKQKAMDQIALEKRLVQKSWCFCYMWQILNKRCNSTSILYGSPSMIKAQKHNLQNLCFVFLFYSTLQNSSVHHVCLAFRACGIKPLESFCLTLTMGIWPMGHVPIAPTHPYLILYHACQMFCSLLFMKEIHELHVSFKLSLIQWISKSHLLHPSDECQV